MSLAAAALAGWVAAVVLAAALVLAVRRSRHRLELAARACHELRGPLTAAELALHGLGRRGAPVGPVQAELGRARLALRDLAAAPTGGREADGCALVDVGALLERHAPAWAAAAAAAGARLELRGPARHLRAAVRGDELRIAQAVANLVGNAAEHAGGRVQVAVRATRATVAIEVRDDGPGLPAPVAELAQRPRGGRGARGRGLAITAGIAAGHGGRLATAPAARGARLVLELPAARGAREVLELPAAREGIPSASASSASSSSSSSAAARPAAGRAGSGPSPRSSRAGRAGLPEAR